MTSCANEMVSTVSVAAMGSKVGCSMGRSLFTAQRKKKKKIFKTKFMPLTITVFKVMSLFNVLPFQWDSKAKKFSSEPQGTVRTISHRFMLACVTLDFSYTLSRVVQVLITHWPIHRSERLSDAILLLGLLGPKMWAIIDTYHPLIRRQDAINFTNQLLHYRRCGMFVALFLAKSAFS